MSERLKSFVQEGLFVILTESQDSMVPYTLSVVFSSMENVNKWLEDFGRPYMVCQLVTAPARVIVTVRGGVAETWQGDIATGIDVIIKDYDSVDEYEDWYFTMHSEIDTEEFGPYDTEEEAYEAIKRVQAEAKDLNDGVSRLFSAPYQGKGYWDDELEDISEKSDELD